MTNKEYLQRAYFINRRLQAKYRRLTVLESQAESTGIDYSGMPHSNSMKSKLEETAIRIVEIKDSIAEDEKALSETRNQVARAIDSIGNESFKTILDMRYLQYMSWEDIINQTEYCRSHVFRLHGEALQCINQYC